MSELVPALLPLDKGLNLQTAKLIAPPGSVLDCLNYEQVDFQGQKRIDGFTRYDGSVLSALDEYYAIVVTSVYTPVVGDIMTDADGVVIGVVAEYSGGTIYLALVNENGLPAVDDVVTFLTNGASSGTGTVVSATSGTLSDTDADDHYNRLLAINAAIRSRVEELPGPIIGLHWFRDRLYAVADVLTVSVDGTTPQFFPNDLVGAGNNPATLCRVLGSVTLANTQVLFLSQPAEAGLWSISGEEVSRNAVAVTTVANGFESFSDSSEIASFFESRTEEQVLTEDAPGPYDFGWRFVHQGWNVDFENGYSLFGSLPSLNQNIQGLGTQGPTSTTGNNGRALVLLQKVNLTNGQAQVSGWKSTATPTSYLLDPDNLTNIDLNYIYADAFISWDATTGTVSAPGYTTSTLTEYSASATVEVEV